MTKKRKKHLTPRERQRATAFEILQGAPKETVAQVLERRNQSWLHEDEQPTHTGKLLGSVRPDDSNPKGLLGIKKVQLGLLPGAGKIYGALAMQVGAVKYSPYNWRNKKVKMTVYMDALERHLLALRDGETIDAGGAPHLGHIIACASILADAIEGGFLIDDRPEPGPVPSMLIRWVKE